MTVIVNGEPHQLDAPLTVAALVARLGCGARGVAVAINRTVVPRSTWAEHVVHDGDAVEVLKAAQGG
jgi:sulfur carrier protein